MHDSRRRVRTPIALTCLLLAGCGGGTAPQAPTPVPSPDAPTANAYILPGAATLGPGAFGDHPVLIFKGERLRWRNADSEEHNLVADTRSLPEFSTTGVLGSGDERAFTMNTPGSTRFHCTIHPQMAGTLVVQQR